MKVGVKDGQSVIECFFFQAEDGIRDAQESRGLGMCIRDSSIFGHKSGEPKAVTNTSHQLSCVFLVCNQAFMISKIGIGSGADPYFGKEHKLGREKSTKKSNMNQMLACKIAGTENAGFQVALR